MIRALLDRIHRAEKALSRSFGKDIGSKAGRRAAWAHFYLSDHGVLRGLWTNQEEIAPGVWRSNQPSPARLRRLSAMGIRTVLNLRGADLYAHYLFEREACAALGIHLVDHKLYARSLVPRERYVELFKIFDTLEKPFLLHCKSGADRAGLVSALWLLDQEGASLEDARKMLSLRYMHLKGTRTGLMDHVLEAYAPHAPMPIREWFATHYDAEVLTASFNAQRGRA